MDWQKDRFKIIGDYKIDRWISNICMLVVFAILFSMAYFNRFDLDYYHCIAPIHDDRINISIPGYSLNYVDPERSSWPAPCKNPFYTPVTWKNMEYLDFGEYGKKPGFLLLNIWWITPGIFGLGALLNHIIHNRRK